MGRLALALAALALVTGCGSDDADESATDAGVSVTLSAQNGSGQSGEAVLTEIDESTTRVELTVSNPPAEPQPAHIHVGTCADLDPQPEYPLQNVVDGSSTTEVAAGLDDLRGLAINVHRSESELQTYVACGDISRGPEYRGRDEETGGY